VHRGLPRQDVRAVRTSQRDIALITQFNLFAMATFTATAYQSFETTRDKNIVNIDNSFTFSVELDANNKKQRDLVVGTFLNRLFRYIKLQQATGARFANLSHPLLMRFNVGTTTIDLGAIDQVLQARLKVGHSPKTKRSFAMRVVAIVEFLLEAPVQMTATELIAGLEDIIAAEAVAELTA